MYTDISGQTLIFEKKFYNQSNFKNLLFSLSEKHQLYQALNLSQATVYNYKVIADDAIQFNYEIQVLLFHYKSLEIQYEENYLLIEKYFIPWNIVTTICARSKRLLLMIILVILVS